VIPNSFAEENNFIPGPRFDWMSPTCILRARDVQRKGRDTN